MSDPVQLTPEALASLLSDLDREAFGAFVADLYEREGWETDRQGSVITAQAPGRDSKHILVWTDKHESPVAGQDAIDIVVTRMRDDDGATAVAEELNARRLDPDDLHDRLLYAIDRDVCRALCQDHFHRDVEPQPNGSDEATETEEPTRRFPVTSQGLVLILSLLVVGIAVGTGFPGVVTPPAGSGVEGPSTPGGGTDPGELPATGTPMPTPTLTPTDHTPRPTPTEPPSPTICAECRNPLSLHDLTTAPDIPPEPDLVAGQRLQINGTANNWFLPGLDRRVVFDNISFETPTNWNITRVNPNTTGAIIVESPLRDVGWELSVPESAEGGMYNLTATTTYHTENLTESEWKPLSEQVRVQQTYSIRVKPADCYEPCGLLRGEETPYLYDRIFTLENVTGTISGTLYNPYPYPLTDGKANIHFGDNVTINTATGTTFEELAPNASQPITWNLTLTGDKARRLENQRSDVPGLAIIGLSPRGNVTYERQNGSRVTVVIYLER